MPHLVDTSLLLRVVARRDPLHPVARNAVRVLRHQNESLCFLSQNMAEFWNTATRPATSRGGFGLTLAETERRARLLEHLFTRLPEPLGAYDEWRRLVVTFGVSGAAVHDARLVAACLAAGVTHILTFNVTDFQRYASLGIVAVDPVSV